VIAEAGLEFVVDATGCDPARLRDETLLRALLGRAIDELELRPVAAPLVHVFPGEGGVTAMVLLAESHLALHTFPELGLATFNLYCCRPRPAWAWESRLAEALGAEVVRVRILERGAARSETP
jgi:S-adenosylmethionine decarboxylase